MVVVAMFAWPSRICTLEAVLQQPGRIAVAQAVRRNALDAGRLGHLPKGGMERIDPDVLAMKPGRKQPGDCGGSARACAAHRAPAAAKAHIAPCCLSR